MVENEDRPVDDAASCRSDTEDAKTAPVTPEVIRRITFEEWARDLEENRARAGRVMQGRDLARFPRTRPRSPDEARWLQARGAPEGSKQTGSEEHPPGPRQDS